jgi:hypothetical protein
MFFFWKFILKSQMKKKLLLRPEGAQRMRDLTSLENKNKEGQWEKMNSSCILNPLPQ